MAWAKFDDRYDDHRKVRLAWHKSRAAVGIHSMAITYCARHETDGLIDEHWIMEHLPVKRERTKVLGVLVEVGLFDVVETTADGQEYDVHRYRVGQVYDVRTTACGVRTTAYRVHDYLKYNPSRESLDTKRARDRDRKASGGRKTDQDSAWNPDGMPTESASVSASLPEVRAPAARPVPSRPDPSTDVDDDRERASAPDRPEPSAVVGVVEQLRRVPEWSAAIDQGADVAVMVLVEANADAPWLALTAEAVASKLDPDPRSIRTPSPRQALDMRLADHRSGRRGGEGRVVPFRGNRVNAHDHYGGMSRDIDAEGGATT